MTWRLHHKDNDFAERCQALVTARRGEQTDVRDVVHTIIQKVQQKGDDALLELTSQLDDYAVTHSSQLLITEAERAAALKQVSKEQHEALAFAAQRIRFYHEAQMPRDHTITDDSHVTMGWRYSAVSSAGLYVPGGTAAYPSSVLMNAIPALVAGVDAIVMAAPTPRGEIHPLVVAAAQLVGITNIYRIGGAQAIAAMALGTSLVPQTDVIVGPGNQYVAEAKRQLFGTVGIDMIAGPSEVLILADKTANPAWLAADLLAQAEHDTQAQAILITDDESLADKTQQEIHTQCATLPRRSIAEESWNNHGAIITVASLADAMPLANRLAPEHLEIMTATPHQWLKHIRYAGAIFLGHHTAEALGDYVAGPNHVLPTSRTARFANPLSVYDFLTRQSTLAVPLESFRPLADAAITLARCEGLEAHARSLEARLS